MISLVTVVFPLPAKDPLLVYRKIYDYSQAFDMIDNKARSAFDNSIGNNSNSSKGDIDGNGISREELLKAASHFQWFPKPMITYDQNNSFGRSQMKFESDNTFKMKGCASMELGGHALLKFTNRLGYEFGSAVVCLSHLIHKDPHSLYSSYMKDIVLSAGGQKRGSISAKFSLKYIPSQLSQPVA